MTRAKVFPYHQVMLAGLVLMSAVILSGCNTVEGLGEDAQSGGRAIENTAQDAAD
ncbi:entericidin A/B family lipoprotein [Azospirillum sp. RWY-5-1]|uniref:Entericidin A/B family lipoprotein n=1 Tax=Azospirillum oleiclasticum TaxID=2735135 RepID=A0ABX2T720_9PROT|nr:entericidin A/B family lipoprotein [Azospirillum oleiclasticum]NYZ11853.1 entericidin A/B family lipoprotein [Azospirillum oleiclasticum]NYZ19013.1 entericidin A/B family lipoprotein [Azospirillum oleiclasticum]